MRPKRAAAVVSALIVATAVLTAPLSAQPGPCALVTRADVVIALGA